MNYQQRGLMGFFGILLLFVALAACSHPPVYMPEAIYYLDSVAGNDKSDGLSPATAWRTIEKLSYTIVAPGSKVLLKSGQIFRGSLLPSSGSSDKPVVYGSFGGDNKAIIQNSIDLGYTSDWKESETGVWKAQATFKFDVGNIIFNGGQCAVRKWSRSDLESQGDFYFDSFWKTLRVKSSSNPAIYYDSAEAALTDHVIDQSNVTYTIFSNLHVKYGGAHGFGGGGTRGLVIQGCEISYMGGGFLHFNNGKPVRYGNGIEFWGDASDNLVEGCYIHDIYDTGVTNQNHTVSVVQENIIYRNNIIENCALASFEFWNRPGTSVMTDILFENNTSINPGEGWGAQRPDLHGSHVTVFSNEAALNGIEIRNNIFYGGNLIYFLDAGVWGSSAVSADNNCLYPVKDGVYDYLCLIWNNSSIETSIKYEADSFGSLIADSGRETDSINADPLFTAMEYPYALSPASPCLDLCGASGF